MHRHSYCVQSISYYTITGAIMLMVAIGLVLRTVIDWYYLKHLFIKLNWLSFTCGCSLHWQPSKTFQVLHSRVKITEIYNYKVAIELIPTKGETFSICHHAYCLCKQSFMQIIKIGRGMHNNAPVNVFPHLPPPLAKSGDLILCVTLTNKHALDQGDLINIYG